jgi:3-deoxy-manno-octulosonate cytidylyltransferase (CMP-KDO synthetase)
LGERSVVKCAVSASGRILFCARDFSRVQLGAGFEPIRRVLGILGYQREFLRRYGALPRTPIESAESIDQSRILEHDVELRSVEFSKGYPGINEPGEVALVEASLAHDVRQRAVLNEILSSRFNEHIPIAR